LAKKILKYLFSEGESALINLKSGSELLLAIVINLNLKLRLMLVRQIFTLIKKVEHFITEVVKVKKNEFIA
jgi:hypothetical protein